MNKCQFIGRLVSDPETSGSVVRFTLAVPDKFNRERVDYLDFKAFKQTADFVLKWFKKGKPMLVESASAKLETWEKDGKKMSKIAFYANEVSFVPFSANENGNVGKKKEPEKTVDVGFDDSNIDLENGNIPF